MISLLRSDNPGGRYPCNLGSVPFLASFGSFITEPLIAIWQLIILLALLILLIRYREKRIRRKKQQLSQMIESRTRELEFQQEELKTQIEFTTIQNHKIENQNRELENHRKNLEDLVKQRTADLEKAKLHAEESDRLKSAFLANMSHEIRTPMNAIVGFTNIMMEEHLSDDEQQELLEHIHDSSNYLLRLIENIIDISKMESGELRFKFRSFDVHEIIGEIYDDFKDHKEIIRKDLKFYLEKENPDQSVMLTSDAYRVKQILTNLMDNAVKFTYRGEVRLGYRGARLKGRDAIEFYVSDTGIGMSAQQQTHIFDLFRKNTGNHSTLYRGTGIGLSICRKLTKGLNGRIKVDSKSGVGSKFTVIIPHQESCSQIRKEDQTEASGNKAPKRSVLLFGKELQLRNNLQERLAEENIRLFCTPDSKEALKIFEDHKKEIDLVIVDSGKELRHNLETASILRDMDQNVPIIGLTRDHSVSLEYQSNGTTFSRFLSYDLNSSHLIHLIHEYIE